MGYVNKISIGEGTHLIEPTLYGISSTAAGTPIKDVTLTSFELITGAQVAIKFTKTNTAAVANLKLKFNGESNNNAKPIKYRGSNLPAVETLTAGRIYNFVYDGTNWELVGDLDTTYSVETAVSGGTTESLVSTGEKFIWNSKQDALTFDGTYSTNNKVATVSTVTNAISNLTAADLNLASALKYVGVRNELPAGTNSTTYSTYNNGDVITVNYKEYAYLKGDSAGTSSWVELGDEGSYKLKQTAISAPTEATNTWASSIGQDADGAISVSYSTLDTSGTWSGTATKIAITTSAPTSSKIVGYIPFSTTITGNNDLYAQDSLYLYDTVTNNAISSVYLNVGKNTTMGGITLHSTNTAAHGNLVPTTLTANTTRTWTLPDENGTIALNESIKKLYLYMNYDVPKLNSYSTPITDMNDAPIGVTRTQNGTETAAVTANAPTNSCGGKIYTFGGYNGSATNYKIQIFAGADFNRTFIRRQSNTTWTNWYRMPYISGVASTAIGGTKIPVYVNTTGEIVAGNELKDLAYQDTITVSQITDIEDNYLSLSGGELDGVVTNTSNIISASGSGIYKTDGAPIFYFLKNNNISSNQLGAIFLNTATTNNTYRADRMYFRTYRYDSSTGAVLNKWDQYYLPEATTSTSSNNSYAILTESNYTNYTIKRDGSDASGTWGISITGSAGSAATASKADAANLTTTTNALAYYSDTAGSFANLQRVTALNHVSLTTPAGNTSYQDGLRIVGTGYGDAAQLLANADGATAYGDGGPQIQFSTGASNQDGAIIFTHYNNTSGMQESFQFVGQSPVAVRADGLIAKTRAIIGDNQVNTSYTLYVNGNSMFTSDVTASQFIREGIGSSWKEGRIHAVLRTTAPETWSSWTPYLSLKTTDGSWDAGAHSSNNQLRFNYCADTVANGTNAMGPYVAFATDGTTSTVRADKFSGNLIGNADTATTATNLASAPTIMDASNNVVTSLEASTVYTLNIGGQTLSFTTTPNTTPYGIRVYKDTPSASSFNTNYPILVGRTAVTSISYNNSNYTNNMYATAHSDSSKLLMYNPYTQTLTIGGGTLTGEEYSGNATTATSSKVLANWIGTYEVAESTGANTNRLTSADIGHVTNGGVVHFKATSNMANKPGDGSILHFNWDTASAWDAQLYIPDSTSWSMQYRVSSKAGTWDNWRTLLDNENTTIPNTVPTLSWGAEATVLTINGSAVKINAMAKPTVSDIGAAAAAHAHGNITNDGKMSGSTASGAVTTSHKFLREDGTWVVPKYTTDTHYTTHLYVNDTAGGAASNTTTTNTTTYMHLYDDNAKHATIQFKGSGGTTVTATGGVITIDSNDDNNAVSQSASTTAHWRKILLHYKDDAAPTTAVTSSTNVVYAAVGVSVQPSTGTIRAEAYNVLDKVKLEYNLTDDSLDFIFI